MTGDACGVLGFQALEINVECGHFQRGRCLECAADCPADSSTVGGWFVYLHYFTDPV
jgi:hypothetical protein